MESCEYFVVVFVPEILMIQLSPTWKKFSNTLLTRTKQFPFEHENKSTESDTMCIAESGLW